MYSLWRDRYRVSFDVTKRRRIELIFVSIPTTSCSGFPAIRLELVGGVESNVGQIWESTSKIGNTTTSIQLLRAPSSVGRGEWTGVNGRRNGCSMPVNDDGGAFLKDWKGAGRARFVTPYLSCV